MAATQYIGVDNVARRIKGNYIGVGGVARKVTNGYIGVGGVARKCYSGLTTIVKSGTGGFDSNGTVTFDSVVPAFTKAVVWIDVPGANRCIYYANGDYTGKTFVVPWGDDGADEDNPIGFIISSDGGTNTYDYSYWDGENLDNVQLSVTVTRSTLSAQFVIKFTEYYDEYSRSYMGYCPLDDASWRVTFTCEGE